MTATLHIEHAITDYPTWKAAFDRFADARTQAGVTTHRIRLDEEDPRQIVIDLDFRRTFARSRLRGVSPRAGLGDRERACAHECADDTRAGRQG